MENPPSRGQIPNRSSRATRQAKRGPDDGYPPSDDEESEDSDDEISGYKRVRLLNHGGSGDGDGKKTAEATETSEIESPHLVYWEVVSAPWVEERALQQWYFRPSTLVHNNSRAVGLIGASVLGFATCSTTTRLRFM